MKKNRMTAAGICVLLAAVSMLGACEKAGGPRGPYIPGEEDEEPVPSPAEAEPEVSLPSPTEAPAPTEAPKPQADIPVLCISQRNSYFGVPENRGWDLFFEYELLHTDKAYGEAHPKLRDALEEVNGFIEEATGETCSGYAEILSSMSKEEYEKAASEGEIPKYSKSRIYTRRADERIVSFLLETAYHEMKFDYEDIGYMAYNFYVDDGSKVEFSDVVADEDALYDLLADKLAVSVNEGREQMFVGDAYEHEELKAMISEYIRTMDAVWVLDPQGISFYFDTDIFGLPWVEDATVLYSEDSSGTIFTDAFREDVRDEWVMMLSKNCNTVFDAEDDAKSDTIRVDDILDIENGGAYYFNTSIGSSVYYNGKYYEYTENSEDQPYDHRAYLVHRNGQTVLMIQHSEYDHDYLDSYRLSGAEVIHAQWMEAGIDYIPFDEMIWGIENVFPAYVPADPGSIPVRRYLYTEAGDVETGALSVGADGALSVSWGD